MRTSATHSNGSIYYALKQDVQHTYTYTRKSIAYNFVFILFSTYRCHWCIYGWDCQVARQSALCRKQNVIVGSKYIQQTLDLRYKSRSVKGTFIIVLQSYPWERVCLRRCYPVKVAYTSLLRICCLAKNVVSLFVSRSLPSNRSTRYSINKIRPLLFYVLNPLKPSDYYIYHPL
jgi:hypothetical protein